MDGIAASLMTSQLALASDVDGGRAVAPAGCCLPLHETDPVTAMATANNHAKEGGSVSSKLA